MAAEGRVEALEAQLGRADSGRRQLENKLTSVYSSLRRVTGLRLDGSGVEEASLRRRSPGKGGHSRGCSYFVRILT